MAIINANNYGNNNNNNNNLSLAKARIFHYATASILVLGPSQPRIQRELGAVFPELKGPGQEGYHLPPASAKVKNVGAIFPIPLTSLLRDA
jgi:hypothetical protein